MSSSSPPGEVVQRPVERRVDDLEGVLGDELLFRRQQLRLDERQHGALDRAASGERRRPGVRVGSYELLLAPREDRADFDLAGIALDLDALRAGDALTGDSGELLLEPPRHKGLTAQPSAANGPAAEREIDARIVELRQHRLLDLIERERPPGDAMRQPLERAGNLSNALRRIVGRPPLDWIVSDD